jgi:hypothetical protein
MDYVFHGISLWGHLSSLVAYAYNLKHSQLLTFHTQLRCYFLQEVCLNISGSVAILCAPKIPWAYPSFRVHLPLFYMSRLFHPMERATSTYLISIPPNSMPDSVNMFWSQLDFSLENEVNSIECLKMSNSSCQQ